MKILTNKDIKYFDSIIKSIAKKYRFIVEFEDLVSEGYLGLCEAAKKYKKDHESNSTFKGFAYRYIRGRIINAVNKQNKHNEIFIETWETEKKI